MQRPLPEGITTIHVPAESELLEIAAQANAAHLHLITNGKDTVLSPMVPAGWHRMGVRVKDAA